jgi:hypothetical protein
VVRKIYAGDNEKKLARNKNVRRRNKAIKGTAGQGN